MSITTVLVYVDPAQQTEQQVRVAREIALKFGASAIGVSALMAPPPLVADYGHSRLGEWLFGGMTRGLLKNARCCLMMSH